MMEEVKELVEMIAKLPQLAIWVLVAFWAYKVIIIGSIYGVIRFVVEKAYAWAIVPEHEKKIVDVEHRFGGLIMGSSAPLIAQVSRLVGKSGKAHVLTSYIHSEDIEWLRRAIDEKEARDLADGKTHAVSKVVPIW